MLVSCLARSGLTIEIVVLGVLADDHAFIDLGARHHEQLAALFQVPQRIGHRLAVAVGDQDAVGAPGDRALVGRIAVEHAVDDAGAARVGEELAVIADQPARRRQEGQPRLARAGRAHVGQFALAVGDLLDHHAGIGIVDVDGDFLDRLQPLAGIRDRSDRARAAG